MTIYTISAAALFAATQRAAMIIEKRNTIPLLSYAAVTFAEGELRLFVTDCDMDFTGCIPAPAAYESPVVFLVPFAPLHAAATALKKAGELECWRDETGALCVRARNGARVYKIADKTDTTHEKPESRISASDLPALKFDGAARLALAATGAEWKERLAQVSEEMSEEETRYYLNGVYVQSAFGARPARLVATDGHRLAALDWPRMNEGYGAGGFIVPSKAVSVLQKIRADKEMIVATFTGAAVRFGSESFTLTSKLIDGTFPDYERVIPAGDKTKTTIQASAADFISFADAASKIHADRSRAVKISANGKTILSVRNHADGAELEEEIPVYKTGADIEAGFNGAYVKSCLRGFGSFSMAFQDPQSPILITSPEAPGLTRVVMPLRV